MEGLDIEVGDYLDVRVRGLAITMAPTKPIPKDQAWFHTPEWQREEREADQAMDLCRGAFRPSPEAATAW